MSKIVLVARPHPFIVNEIRPFLEQSGYTVSKPESVADIAPLARGSKAAVISLALSSPIAATPDEVVKAIRRESPRIPLLFASLLPLNQVRQTLERIAKDAGSPVTILGISEVNDANQRFLGSPQTYFYISKDDLTDPALQQRTRSLIVRHFG